MAGKALGRPSLYSEDLADRICREIIKGRSVRNIADDEGMPALSQIYRWLTEHADFQDNYARAREIQGDVLAGEIQAIADDESIPPESRRVRIDARKWLAGKLRPKVYGDKQQVELSGEVAVKSLSDEELAGRKQALLVRLGLVAIAAA